MIRIGIVVAKNSVELFKPVMKEFQDTCELSLFSYRDLKEIKSIFEENLPFFDGFLFGGPLPYYFLESEIDQVDIPFKYVNLSERDFYMHLFKLVKMYNSHDLSRVFMDFIMKENNYFGLSDFLTREEFPYHLEEEDYVNSDNIYEEILSAHKRLWKEGKIDLSVTRISNLVEPLKDLGYKVYYMNISSESVKEKLTGLIGEIEVNRFQKNQIVIGNLQLSREDDINDKELEKMKQRVRVFGQNYNVSLSVQENATGIEIITSYGELQIITEDFSRSLLAGYLKETVGGAVHIGWGYGVNLAKIQRLCTLALREAKSYPESCSFIIGDNEEYIGPLLAAGHAEENQEETEPNYPLVEISHEVGISVFKLNRIVSAMRRLQTTELTSQDVADALGNSVRSANRLLNKLVEKGLATVKQKRQSSTKGRPVKVYKIQLTGYKEKEDISDLQN